MIGWGMILFPLIGALSRYSVTYGYMGWPKARALESAKFAALGVAMLMYALVTLYLLGHGI